MRRSCDFKMPKFRSFFFQSSHNHGAISKNQKVSPNLKEGVKKKVRVGADNFLSEGNPSYFTNKSLQSTFEFASVRNSVSSLDSRSSTSSLDSIPSTSSVDSSSSISSITSKVSIRKKEKNKSNLEPAKKHSLETSHYSANHKPFVNLDVSEEDCKENFALERKSKKKPKVITRFKNLFISKSGTSVNSKKLRSVNDISPCDSGFSDLGSDEDEKIKVVDKKYSKRSYLKNLSKKLISLSSKVKVDDVERSELLDSNFDSKLDTDSMEDSFDEYDFQSSSFEKKDVNKSKLFKNNFKLKSDLGACGLDSSNHWADLSKEGDVTKPDIAQGEMLVHRKKDVLNDPFLNKTECFDEKSKQFSMSLDTVENSIVLPSDEDEPPYSDVFESILTTIEVLQALYPDSDLNKMLVELKDFFDSDLDNYEKNLEMIEKNLINLLLDLCSKVMDKTPELKKNYLKDIESLLSQLSKSSEMSHDKYCNTERSKQILEKHHSEMKNANFDVWIDADFRCDLFYPQVQTCSDNQKPSLSFMLNFLSFKKKDDQLQGVDLSNMDEILRGVYINFKNKFENLCRSRVPSSQFGVRRFYHSSIEDTTKESPSDEIEAIPIDNVTCFPESKKEPFSMKRPRYNL